MFWTDSVWVATLWPAGWNVCAGVCAVCPHHMSSLSFTLLNFCFTVLITHREPENFVSEYFPLREEKKTVSVGKGYFLTSEAGGHGNQPLIKWLKCNFLCLGWTFFWTFMVFEDYSLLFQVKILKFPVLVLCVNMEVCIFSVETVYRYTEPSSRQVCGANKPLYMDPYSLHQVSVPLCVIIIHGDV